jgi:hypothetical protein
VTRGSGSSKSSESKNHWYVFLQGKIKITESLVLVISETSKNWQFL